MTVRMPEAVVDAPRLAVRDGRQAQGFRSVAEETAIALTYSHVTHAVMMASPCDLEDFAIGFSLSEGIIAVPQDVSSIEIVPSELGIEVRMELAAAKNDVFTRRRRHLAGAVGCGLCGIESLKEAVRLLPPVDGSIEIASDMILTAITQLSAAQSLNKKTRAVHAAAFWTPAKGLIAVREDVGRHNALDKLGGALARNGVVAASGMIVISSRVSVEMVQKAATFGSPVLVAVSAPSALAIRSAEQAGITLVAVARDDGFEVFTNPYRITGRKAEDAA